MDIKSRERMELFIEKSDMLRNGNFYQKLLNEGYKFDITFRTEAIEMHDNLPQGEALYAAAITLRMFMQNNDSISFGRMSELLNDPDISQNWKDQFSDVRSKLNTRLDSDGGFLMYLNGEKLTLGKILNIFMYGEIAHTQPEKRKAYQKWKNNPIEFYLIHHNFTKSVLEMIRAILYVAEINRIELNGKTVPTVNR